MPRIDDEVIQDHDTETLDMECIWTDLGGEG